MLRSLAAVTDLPPPPPPGFPPPPPPGSFGAPPPGYTTIYGAVQQGPVLHYAGVGARLGALLIDAIVTGLFFVPAFVVLNTGPTKISSCTVDSSGDVTFGGGRRALCEVPTAGTFAAAALLGLLALAVTLFYYARLEGGPKGQTVGKKAVGVRVVDATTAGPIGPGRAVGRYLFKSLISGNLCLLGYLWAFWDSRKQSWHDKVVSSVVVKV